MSRRKSLGAKLFGLVEADQGFSFISDAVDELPDERVMDIARGSLKHTENVARKLRAFLGMKVDRYEQGYTDGHAAATEDCIRKMKGTK